jgi:hypothetical protein
MAHWAELDKNSVVIRVTVGSNEEADEGYNWLVENLGGRWIKTSFTSRAGKRINPDTGEVVGNDHFRYNFASPGMIYNEEFDAFHAPEPQAVGSEVYALDPESFVWKRI